MAFLQDGVRKTFAQFQQDVSLFLKVYCVCPIDGQTPTPADDGQSNNANVGRG